MAEVLSEEEIARRRADVAAYKRADEAKEYVQRLLDESGCRGQIADIKEEEQNKINAAHRKLHDEKEAAVENRVAALLGESFVTAVREAREAEAAVDNIVHTYLFDEDDDAICCAVTGVPICDEDWYLSDASGNTYVLASAIGLKVEERDDD